MPAEVDFIRSLPYFAALSGQQLQRVAEQAMYRTFERGEVLFMEGEPCLGLYSVKSGAIRVFKSSPEGREQVLMVARTGMSFNDVPVFDGGPNPASAAALESTGVIIVPTDVVLSLIQPCPPARGIIKLLAGRLRYMSNMVGDLSFRSVLSRLAKVLLEVAVEERGASPVPRLTQEEMAAMVGTVRDVIGRALRSLERDGAIRIQRQRIVVTDPDKLRSLL